MRRPRLAPLLGAASIALPVLEILLIIRVGHWIGAGPTFLLLVAGVVVGVWIIQTEGRRSLSTLRESARRGQSAKGGLITSGSRLLAGILLVIPGFITDAIALLVVIPPTRRMAGRLVSAISPVKTTWVPPAAPTQGDQSEPTVVRGDVL